MTDTVLVALIASVTNLAAIFISRWLSSREHRSTKVAIDEIRTVVNGGKK